MCKPESLRLRATAASSEHALMTMREHLQLVRNEQVMVAGEVVNIRNAGLQEHQHLRDRLGVGLQEQQHLRNRLDEEEEFRSMAVQRMQQAEDQLRQVENSARQTLPTMHGELNELRRALKLQEGVQARTRSELEAARHAPQGLRQPSSSMPISSRATESGWGYLSRDRVQAFPVGSDIRSPEIHTPSHRSPVNREVFDFTLLATLGTKGRFTSSSCSAVKGVSYDGNLSSDSAVAHVVAGQTKPVMLPRNFDDSVHASQLIRTKGRRNAYRDAKGSTSRTASSN